MKPAFLFNCTSFEDQIMFYMKSMLKFSSRNRTTSDLFSPSNFRCCIYCTGFTSLSSYNELGSFPATADQVTGGCSSQQLQMKQIKVLIYLLLWGGGWFLFQLGREQKAGFILNENPQKTEGLKTMQWTDYDV